MFREPISARSTTSQIFFQRAFRLGRDSRELPAGSYVVHTHEEAYSSAVPLTYIPVSVEVAVEEIGRTSFRLVDPADLQAAIALDKSRVLLDSELSENPDRGRPSGGSNANRLLGSDPFRFALGGKQR